MSLFLSQHGQFAILRRTRGVFLKVYLSETPPPLGGLRCTTYLGTRPLGADTLVVGHMRPPPRGETMQASPELNQAGPFCFLSCILICQHCQYCHKSRPILVKEPSGRGSELREILALVNQLMGATLIMAGDAWLPGFRVQSHGFS